MHSELRDWYLSNMGIVQYIPRGSAAVEGKAVGAAPVELSVPLESASQQQAAARKSAAGLALVKSKLLADKGELSAASSAPQQDVPTEAVPTTTGSHDSEVVTFRLACWQPTDDLLIFDSLELGQQPSPEKIQLLSNMIRAINRLPEGLPAAEIINWPAYSGAPADEAGARSMLSVFLDARIKQRGVLWVLVMGEQAVRYLINSDKSYSELLGARLEIAGGTEMIVVRDLDEMLLVASCKADTWAAIKFLSEQG